ncbi:Uncharacterised protein [Vibrio cholerae]|nr:Uncharacterised protein [Vibrio cholerae]
MIPVEALFLSARHGATAIIVFIHIDKAVAFFVLASGERYTVDTAPRGVTHHFNTVIVDRLFDCRDMLREVANSVIIVD